jgi:hypothetical protein
MSAMNGSRPGKLDNSRGSEEPRDQDLPVHDLSEFLHALRTRELCRMPPGARTVVSGGCAGSWYFRWFAENYPSVQRHLGVEAFSPEPEDLPPGAEWVKNTLGDMTHVPANEADMVFAGQVVEHVWPEDLAGFLCEAHRVLRPGGWLVTDSPNRRVTQPLAWYHPEHTAELTVDEIVDLLETAGFDHIEVRGLWLCYDRDGHRYLPLEPKHCCENWPPARRVTASEARPEDCFIWWTEAQKLGRQPDRARLLRRASEIFELVRPITLSRFAHSVGTVSGLGRDRVVTAGVGEVGYLVFGPNVPVAPGRYRLGFALGRAEPGTPEGLGEDEIVAEFDVCAQTNWPNKEVVTRRAVRLGELPEAGLREFILPLDLPETRFGVEYRAVTNGRIALAARLHVDLSQWGPQDAATPPLEPRSAADEEPVGQVPPRISKTLSLFRNRLRRGRAPQQRACGSS